MWIFIPFEIFHSFGDVIITGKGLQILTSTRSENSLTCHTYYVNLLLWLFSRNRNKHTYYRAVGSGAVITCFNDLGLSRILDAKRIVVELSIPVLTT